MVTLTGRRARGVGAPRKASAEHLVVGKDIIELLSTAMYVDPLAIYREYVQNAVDSIDEAVRSGVLGSTAEGQVEITLDPAERSARVRDNGMGLPASDAERVLTAFGASRKRGMPAGQARGFRGVGRLAALGYAQALTFRTKSAGEPRGVEVRWDCRKLRSILLAPAYTGSLNEVVSDVVTVCEGAEEDLGVHYFEVHLEKVVRMRGDELLNEHEVASYLSQVAPVPFRQDFSFREAIEAHLGHYGQNGTYRIRVNDSDPLERPVRDEFALTQTKTDRFQELQLVEIEDPETGTVAVGWILHHNYLGALQGASELRGLRARVGNLQIGGSDLFADVYPEPRFNAWTVGELHIVDRRIVPNGRRDHFERNAAANTLFHRLVTYTREIARRCRVSSTRRVQLKRFEAAEQKVLELLGILEQGAVGLLAAESLRKEVGSLFGVIEKLAGALALDPLGAVLAERLEGLRERFGALRRALGEDGEDAGAATLQIPERDRAAYVWAVELIYECAANRGAAKALIDRITARLAGTAAGAPEKRVDG